MINEGNARIIVLDRDGVINADSPDYIKTPDEWIALPGSPEAIALLSNAGYRVYVATNQSGIGRGLYTDETYQAINRKMLETIESAGGNIEAVVYCPHSPEDGCECRKPKDGLMRQIESMTGEKLTGAIVVGDSARDLKAAESVGAQRFLVLTGNGRKTAEETNDSEVRVFDDLLAIARELTGA